MNIRKMQTASGGPIQKEVLNAVDYVKDYYNSSGFTLKNNKNLNMLYNYYAKQGGKMNILEFLKNGSGIHIKEKNKGSFTRWCGGNVTEECIRRGKNSSNPKIRKKATFADNARHFKHRLGGLIIQEFKLKRGGKAFVAGVSVLDSNPNIYKHEKKKKLKKAQQGSKMDWGQIASSVALFGTLLAGTIALNRALEKQGEALKLNKLSEEGNFDMSPFLVESLRLFELEKLNNPNFNYTNNDVMFRANKLAESAKSKFKNKLNQQYLSQLLGLKLQQDLNYLNMISGGINLATNVLSSIGNNTSIKNNSNTSSGSTFNTPPSIYKNNSMFSSLNYSNPNYVNNFFNKS